MHNAPAPIQLTYWQFTTVIVLLQNKLLRCAASFNSVVSARAARQNLMGEYKKNSATLGVFTNKFWRLDGSKMNHRSEIAVLPAPTFKDPEEPPPKNGATKVPPNLKQKSYKKLDTTTWVNKIFYVSNTIM